MFCILHRRKLDNATPDASCLPTPPPCGAHTLYRSTDADGPQTRRQSGGQFTTVSPTPSAVRVLREIGSRDGAGARGRARQATFTRSDGFDRPTRRCAGRWCCDANVVRRDDATSTALGKRPTDQSCSVLYADGVCLLIYSTMTKWSGAHNPANHRASCANRKCTFDK